MNVYRIKSWETLYENNRTRELKTLSWVPIPNKQDGDGYTLLMERKNGAALYGAWIACVMIASRCDVRGTLLRDGGKPHNSASLSRMSRIPEPLIEEMLKTFSDKDFGWLEIIDIQGENEVSASQCENPAPTCDNPAGGCLEGKERTEGKEQNRTEGAWSLLEFDEFWKAYPKKRGKQECLKIWKKLKPPISKVLETLAWQTKSNDWTKDDGKFIPDPERWLNKGRWDDEPTEKLRPVSDISDWLPDDQKEVKIC